VGIRYSRKQGTTDYILLLNNDTVVKQRFVTELIKHYDRETGVSAPIIFNYYKPNEIWSSGGEYSIIKGVYSNSTKKIKNKKKETNFITGCCWLVKQEIFGESRLLDEDYFLYSEDVDFCYRLRKAGYKLEVVPSSIIFHKISKTTRQNFPLMFYYFHRSKLMFIYKNYKGFKKYFYLTLNIIIRFIRAFEYFIKGEKDLSKSIIKAIRDYKKYV
jgi:GT2 family glycosyltransferase